MPSNVSLPCCPQLKLEGQALEKMVWEGLPDDGELSEEANVVPLSDAGRDSLRQKLTAVLSLLPAERKREEIERILGEADDMLTICHGAKLPHCQDGDVIDEGFVVDFVSTVYKSRGSLSEEPSAMMRSRFLMRTSAVFLDTLTRRNRFTPLADPRRREHESNFLVAVSKWWGVMTGQQSCADQRHSRTSSELRSENRFLRLQVAALNGANREVAAELEVLRNRAVAVKAVQRAQPLQRRAKRPREETT